MRLLFRSFILLSLFFPSRSSSCHKTNESDLVSKTSILHLNLSCNTFGGSITTASFSNSLQSLNLSHNRFTNRIHLSAFSNLKILDLSHNPFIQTLPSGFQNLTKLTHLDLSNCNITGITHLDTNLSKLLFWSLNCY